MKYEDFLDSNFLFATFSNDFPFKYNKKTNKLIIDERIASKYGLKTVYKDMPYSFADDFVSKEYHSIYVNSFLDFLISKSSRFYIKYKSKFDDTYRIDILTVCEDNEHVIGFSKDITLDYEKKKNAHFLEVIHNFENKLLDYHKDNSNELDALAYLSRYFNCSDTFINFKNETYQNLNNQYKSINTIFKTKEELTSFINESVCLDGGIHIHDVLSYNNLTNFLEIPIFDSKRETIGCLGILNYTIFPTSKGSLEFLSNSLSLGIQNILKHNELYKSSYYDELTGVNNRNAYENLIKSKDFEKTNQLGIAIVDVNGLKYCNDTYGHDAGDILIKTVADELKIYFASDKIYRCGGDEFFIITKRKIEDFLESVDSFKEQIKEKAAIGYEYRTSNINYKEMKDIADNMMYDDKRKAYEKNKTLDRRRTK